MDAGYFNELIDTCWDVNKLEMITGQGTNAELIDTCWDVNYTSLQIYCPFSGN